MTDRWTEDPQVQADPDLRGFLHGLSARADDSVDPAIRAATLEAMLATAAASSAPAPRPTWGRRARRVLGLTGVKLALAAGVAAATTTGGLAATGSLPAPIQEFAHDVGRQIGIGVPDSPGPRTQAPDDPGSGRDGAPGQDNSFEGSTTGPDVAPGQQRDLAPGQQRDDAPGQQRDDDPPGGSGDAPRNDDLPRDGDAPARTGDLPRNDDAPAHTGDLPRSDDAPDGAGDVLRNDEAPAHTGDLPDRDDPGQSGPAPEQPVPPPPPPVEDPPTGAENETTPGPATAPGRPDTPVADNRPSPERGNQGGGAPDGAGQGGSAPDGAGQGGSAPDGAGQGGSAPDGAGARGTGR